MTVFKSAFAKKPTGLLLKDIPNRTGWAPAKTPGPLQAATAKAAANNPAPAPAPWDPQYEQTRASLAQNRDTNLANLAADRSTLQSSYGYNLDGTENTSDPYSRLAMLRADYEKIKRGSSATLASAGMGYDGAFQNAVNRNQENQNRALDALKKDFGQQATALRNQETSIYNDYTSGITAAGNERIDRAASNVADGTAPVATPNTRMQAVLNALAGKLSPSHRKRLENEARKNGWIQ